jgi:phytol kinase
MLVQFIVSLVIAETVFWTGEHFRRKLGYSNETSRKLVHAIHGLLVAIWPFIIGYKWTIVIEVLFLLSVLSARKFHLFSWMWRVGRTSWGEILYPLGIIAAALTANSKWIYLAAALELGIADAAAALIGKRFGRGNDYKIWGQTKSTAGSIAFFVTSCLILGGIVGFTPLDLHGLAVMTVLSLAVLLTLAENLGVYGLDNFFLPLLTVAALNWLG